MFLKKPEKKELKSKNPIDLEKGDFLALMIAAFTTIVPAILLFLGLIYFFIYLVFLR